jgi:hypothetical protein
MPGNKFSFGSASRMKEVPIGQHAELKFSGGMEMIETEWGDKASLHILLFSHPSYESLPKEGYETVWESKSECALQVLHAVTEYGNAKGGNNDLDKALKNNKWKLTRTQEGTYFLDEL